MKWREGWLVTARWPFQNSIRVKINVGIIAIVLLSVVLIALSTSQIVSRALVREHRNRGIALAANLAARSGDAILALDFLRLKTLTSTGTVEYDRTAGGQTVATVTYNNLEVDNSAQVALTGGDITVNNDVTDLITRHIARHCVSVALGLPVSVIPPSTVQNK